MRRLAFLALGATALCAAVGYSPGPEVLFPLTFIALTIIALAVVAVPWLKSTFSLAADDLLTGHGHVHLRADGLGAGGRHGPPRTVSVLVMLAVWALVTRVWHALMSLGTSAGHGLSNTNTAAQPLPS